MITQPVRFISIILIFLLLPVVITAQQGKYFIKKEYTLKQLPAFETARDNLPVPVYDESPDYVSCYWKAWEIAFRNFYNPTAENGFVSQFADAAFNKNIFLWDSCFMTMFLNYAHLYVPGISTLDNFYAKQHENGEICREINRETGKNFEPWINKEKHSLFSRWGLGKDFPVIYKNRKPPEPAPDLTLDALNHPVLAWAEIESYNISGDKKRLAMVYEPLVKYYRVLQKYLRQGNGLYITDWASMDNSPRNPYLKSGGTAIDISSEMVLFARNLARMAAIIGNHDDTNGFENDATELTNLINKYMWDDDTHFYYDLTLNNEKIKIKTIAGFWTLIANVASEKQVVHLVHELNDSTTFRTVHRVPTLAASDSSFNPYGGYWRGSVWAPTNTMVILGLEKYGYTHLAREIALNHLSAIVSIFNKTGTIWENYAAGRISQGDLAKPDFVGWSGIGPIKYLIEYAIGIKCDAENASVTWNISSSNRVGLKNLWFADGVISLVAEKANKEARRQIHLESTKDVQIKIIWNEHTHTIKLSPGEKIEKII